MGFLLKSTGRSFKRNDLLHTEERTSLIGRVCEMLIYFSALLLLCPALFQYFNNLRQYCPNRILILCGKEITVYL